MTTPTCGSKYTPRSAISFSADVIDADAVLDLHAAGVDGEPD